METDLYLPVKQFLETLGFQAKGEIGGCDVVAIMEGEERLIAICELKQTFNLELILQGVDRMTMADEVWIAARLSARGKGRESDRRFLQLCRRLGLGMLGVSSKGRVEILISPDASVPRNKARRRSRLVTEHERRRGDPVPGGGSRAPIMTAYRQRALACAAALESGPLRPRDLKIAAEDAPKILLGNVYGWFYRVEKGLYGLSDAGHAALARWPEVRRAASERLPGSGSQPLELQ